MFTNGVGDARWRALQWALSPRLHHRQSILLHHRGSLKLSVNIKKIGDMCVKLMITQNHQLIIVIT